MENEFNEYVREVFSATGDIVIKSMMGGYLVYLNGKLIGDICDNELFLKRTPTSLEMYRGGNQFYGGDGIVKKGVERTIEIVGKLASRGMVETDKEIIRLMMEN